MGPGGPGGPRSPGGPWGGTGAIRRGHGGGTAQLRGAPTASGKDLGGGAARGGTHLLASLAGDARGTGEPGVARAVRIGAVTLRGAARRQHRGWMCPAARGTAPPSPAKHPKGIRCRAPSGTCHSPEPPQLSGTGQSTGRKPKVTRGGPPCAKKSPRGAAPHLAGAQDEAVPPLIPLGHSILDGTEAKACPERAHGVPMVCPERAQPCARLLLCAAAAEADALGSVLAFCPRGPPLPGGFQVPGGGRILTRAQPSLPGAPGMPRSPFSPLTPPGASKAACSWAQSPQRFWEEEGGQRHPGGLGDPQVGGGHHPETPGHSPSAPRCSSRP